MKKGYAYHFRPEDLTQFYRYEMPYETLLSRRQKERYPAFYITFEDVYEALKNIKKRDPYLMDLDMQWLGPLTDEDMFGTAELFGMDEDQEIEGVDWRRALDAVPLHKRSFSIWLFSAFKLQVYTAKDDSAKINDLDEFLEMADNVIFNQDRPMSLWRLSITQKLRYITDLFDNERVDLVSQDEKDLYRRCTDDCCELGIYDALRVKAYACYGGNTVYSCDWNLAKEYLTILAEEDDDAFAMNSLGFIYFNGRCTQGKPDYVNAYKYFSVAAFRGLYESSYMCSDLLREGLGCLKSTETAQTLLEYVYARTKEEYVNGNYVCAFADAALRMGDAQKRDTESKDSEMLALSYYLEAYTAIDRRMQYEDVWGDEKVYTEIVKRLTQQKELLGERCRQSSFLTDVPFVVDRMLKAGYSLKMKVQDLKDGDYVLNFTRMDAREDHRILLTVEECGFSGLEQEFNVSIHDMKNEVKGGDEIEVDAVGYDWATKRTYFYLEQKEVYSFVTDHFLFVDLRDNSLRDEKIFDFAKVVFPGEKRIYTYLCTLGGLQKGDHLMADSAEGETEVIFVGMFHAGMSEMPLSKERYRSILRKKGKRILS